MACRLYGAKPLSESMLPYCQLDPTEHISMEFYSKFKSFRSRKTLENVVCDMAAILSRPQWVNTWLQWIGQRQLQDEMRNIKVLGFGAAYIDIWRY